MQKKTTYFQIHQLGHFLEINNNRFRQIILIGIFLILPPQVFGNEWTLEDKEKSIKSSIYIDFIAFSEVYKNSMSNNYPRVSSYKDIEIINVETVLEGFAGSGMLVEIMLVQIVNKNYWMLNNRKRLDTLTYVIGYQPDKNICYNLFGFLFSDFNLFKIEFGLRKKDIKQILTVSNSIIKLNYLNRIRAVNFLHATWRKKNVNYFKSNLLEGAFIHYIPNSEHYERTLFLSPIQ